MQMLSKHKSTQKKESQNYANNIEVITRKSSLSEISAWMGNLPLIELPSVNNKITETSSRGKENFFAARANINHEQNFYRNQIRHHRKKNGKRNNHQAQSQVKSQSKIQVSRYQPYLRSKSELLKEREAWETYLTFVHNTLNQVNQIGTLV